MNNNRTRIYKWIALLSAITLMMICFYAADPVMAEEGPGLRYPSKVIYIDGDKFGKYTDSCYTPSQNITGWSAGYQIIEGEDIIEISKNGKITALGTGIGLAKVLVTYRKSGETDKQAVFSIKVRRNASHVRLRDQSIKVLETSFHVGDVIVFNAAKSYDGSYRTGHFGINNYRGVVNDTLRLESLTPDIITADGMNITAVSTGIGRFVVKAYQYGDDRFTGVQSQIYTIHIQESAKLPNEADIPEPTSDTAPSASAAPEPTGSPAAGEDTTPYFSSEEKEIALQIYSMVDEFRNQAGLEPLFVDKQLAFAAMRRAIEISEVYSHIRPKGTDFSSVLHEFEILYNGVGENIAYGFYTAEVVMEAWKNQEFYRSNLEYDKFTATGIGIYRYQDIFYFVQLFMY